MKHIFLLCLCGTLAVGCKKSTHDQNAPAKPALSAAAASATASAAPSASASAPVAASAAPSAAAAASQIPVEEDFELGAETAITKANLKQEVDKLSAEIGK